MRCVLFDDLGVQASSESLDSVVGQRNAMLPEDKPDCIIEVKVP